MRLWEDAYLAAGGDLRSVISYYLYHTKSGKKNRLPIVENLRKSFAEKTTKQERNLSLLLDGVKNLFAGYTKDEDRIRLLELLIPIFSKTELIQRGVPLNRELWDRARKTVAAPAAHFDGQEGLEEGEEPAEHLHDHNLMKYDLHVHALHHHDMYVEHIPGEEEEIEDDELPPGHGLKRQHGAEDMPENYIMDPSPHGNGGNGGVDGDGGPMEDEETGADVDNEDSNSHISSGAGPSNKKRRRLH